MMRRSTASFLSMMRSSIMAHATRRRVDPTMKNSSEKKKKKEPRLKMWASSGFSSMLTPSPLATRPHANPEKMV